MLNVLLTVTVVLLSVGTFAGAVNCGLPPIPATAAYIATLTGCDTIPGDLVLGYSCASSNDCARNAPPTLTGEVSLGSVTAIDGKLTCLGNGYLTKIEAPQLLSVSGDLFISKTTGAISESNSLLAGVWFPVLRNVTGTLAISNNPALTAMVLPVMKNGGVNIVLGTSSPVPITKAPTPTHVHAQLEVPGTGAGAPNGYRRVELR